MKNGMGLSAVIAIVMAIAFLPGVFAQQSAAEGAVTGVREQVGAATGAATGACAGLTAQIAPIAASLGVGVEALLGGVFGGVFSLLTSCIVAIFSLFTPIWAACFSLFTPIWSELFSFVGFVINGGCNVWQEIIGTIGDLYLCLQSIAGTILGGVFSCITPVWAACFSLLTPIWAACFSLLTPIWSELFSFVGFVINGGCNVWQEIIGTIGDLWAGFNDIDMTGYLFQSAKIVLWAACSTIFRYTHLLRVIGTYIPCWGYAVTCFRGCVQLCLLWNNCFVRLGQHAVPVI